MPTNPEPSPTPWEIDDKWPWAIIDANGLMIAECIAGPSTPNAQRIVDAVNCHEDLVCNLQEILRWADDPIASERWTRESKWLAFRLAIQEARDALAKAKEGR